MAQQPANIGGLNVKFQLLYCFVIVFIVAGKAVFKIAPQFGNDGQRSVFAHITKQFCAAVIKRQQAQILRFCLRKICFIGIKQQLH